MSQSTLPTAEFGCLRPPLRTLMGPGPSLVAPSVYAALARPTIGHLDPEFVRMMEEVKVMLRATKLAGNAHTSAFGNDAFNFFCPQAAQHVADTLA